MDAGVAEDYQSYTYRKAFRVSPAEYDALPAHVVDWDLAFLQMDAEVEAEMRDRHA